MKELLMVAGTLQIAIAIASIWIPGFLNFHTERKKMSKLLSQLFWVYAIYIFGFNFFFGVLSICQANALVNGSSLALGFTLLMALYWLARLYLQFFHLDKSGAPKGGIFTFANWSLSLAFIYLAGIYTYATLINLNVF